MVFTHSAIAALRDELEDAFMNMAKPRWLVSREDFYAVDRSAGRPSDPIDLAQFPHQCPRCSSPAYVGLTSVECSRAGCEHGPTA
jgi:hypothetical protein